MRRDRLLYFLGVACLAPITVFGIVGLHALMWITVGVQALLIGASIVDDPHMPWRNRG